MQILEEAPKFETYQNEKGSYIKGFLISTKPNKNKWKITKPTPEYVNRFVGKDFVVIPERIGKQWALDGHAGGTKEEVLKTYSDNSYGKIESVLGPFDYNDGTDDVYYEHITKLTNNKVASALLSHGQTTKVKFATSPHIFVTTGSDEAGWDGWEPAGICLVGNPAYGNQSIITKMCNGSAPVCTKALENRVAAVIQALTSYSSTNTQSEPLVMSENNAAPNPTSEQTNQITETKITKTDIPSTAEQPKQQEVQQSTDSEKVKILEAKIATMENEKKAEILNSMFSVISDEKERNSQIKEIAESRDLDTIKYIKTLVDQLAPLYKKQGQSELEKQIKAKEDAIKEQNLKFSKSKVASFNPRKYQLPGEPTLLSDPNNGGEEEGGGGEDPNSDKKSGGRIASTQQRRKGEVVELMELLNINNKGANF